MLRFDMIETARIPSVATAYSSWIPTRRTMTDILSERNAEDREIGRAGAGVGGKRDMRVAYGVLARL